MLVEMQHKGIWQRNSQNSDTAAPNGTEPYNVQFLLQAASPETWIHPHTYNYNFIQWYVWLQQTI